MKATSPARHQEDLLSDRRNFFTTVSVIAGALAAAIVAAPSITFLLGLRKAPQVWRSVGRLDEFQLGTTVRVSFLDPSPLPWSGVTAQTAAWLRRSGEQEFVAFSVHCTHLGCPLRWLPEADLFMCPCHGGVFYKDGQVASGPPPKPLVRYPVRVSEGLVEILTSPIPIT
jgi:menaquinol-cytochrome c reductase iron-sulfur subunit